MLIAAMINRASKVEIVAARAAPLGNKHLCYVRPPPLLPLTDRQTIIKRAEAARVWWISLQMRQPAAALRSVSLCCALLTNGVVRAAKLMSHLFGAALLFISRWSIIATTIVNNATGGKIHRAYYTWRPPSAAKLLKTCFWYLDIFIFLN
jgi:hypothetical protein